MVIEQKGNNPDPTTAAGFEVMVRRLLGLGPNDGLCEHCVYLADAGEVDGEPSPCGGCTDWDRFVRAVPRPCR